MADDIAALGLRFETQQVDQANKKLDDLNSKAKGAEKATDALAGASKRAGGATAQMVASIERTLKELLAVTKAQNEFVQGLAEGAAAAVREARAVEQATGAMRGYGAAAGQAARAGQQLDAHLVAHREHLARLASSQKLAARSGLDLSRQLADVGVMAAMGSNPLMILISQGPQIADSFAVARAGGIGFTGMLRGMMAMLAPMAPVLAVIAAGAAVVAGAFGLLHHQLSKGYPKDITDGLDLTDEQLKRVTGRTVTFGDTVAATFTVIGRRIMDGPVGEAIDWLGDKFAQVLDYITKLMVDFAAREAGLMMGAAMTIAQHWKNIPNIIGNAVAGAVNFVVDGAQKMINGAIEGLNKLIALANLVPGVKLGSVGAVSLGGFRMQGPGGATLGDVGRDFARNASSAEAGYRGYMGGLISDIGQEAIARRRRKALEEAGEPGKAGAGRKGRDHADIRDRSEEEAARVAQMIAQAKGDELQAQLALTTDLRERADIEKQILGAETAAKRAQLDKQIADLKDAQGVANKDALLAELEKVRAIQDHVAQLKAEKIERDLAVALVRQEAELRQSAIQNQQDVLNSQIDLAQWGFQRTRIQSEMLKLEQQMAMDKAKEALAVAEAAKDAVAIAKARAAIAALEAVQANQTAADKAANRFPGLAAFEEASQYFTSAIRDIGDAIRAHDWARALQGLYEAINKAKAAWQSGDRAGAVAGAANAIGQTVGGRAGAGISGAANGFAAGSAIGGPVGGVIGATLGFFGGIMGHDRAKKEEARRKALEKYEKELSEAREIAAEGIRRLQEAEEQRFGLLQRLYQAQNNDAELQRITRAREMEGMDERNRALAQYVYGFEDWRAAMDKADDAVADAKAALTDAYQREADAIRETQDALKDWIASLKDFYVQLTTGDLAMNDPGRQYGLTRARYGSTTDLALSGNQAARESYTGAAAEYLEASKANSRTMIQYLRDLAGVKANTLKLQASAEGQLTVAEQQLMALNAQVSGLVAINSSVLSVKDAIAALAVATAQQAAVAASRPADNPALMAEDPWKVGGELWNQARARGAADAAAGAWGDPNRYNNGNAQEMVLGNWRTNPDQVRAWYANAQAMGSLLAVDAYFGFQAGTFSGFVRNLGLPVFAQGGSFMVGGSSGIDQNVLSINGQAAARVSQGETIKVTSKGDPGAAAVVAAIERLGERIAKVEKHAETTSKTLTNVTRGGNAMVTEAAS